MLFARHAAANCEDLLCAGQVSLLKWNGRVISVDVPNTVELQVVQTDPGVKGNTASGAPFRPVLTIRDSYSPIAVRTYVRSFMRYRRTHSHRLAKYRSPEPHLTCNSFVCSVEHASFEPAG